MRSCKDHVEENHKVRYVQGADNGHSSDGSRGPLIPNTMFKTGLVLVFSPPEVHEPANAKALLLGSLRLIFRWLLFVAKLAAFCVGSNNQLGETGETRSLRAVSLAGTTAHSGRKRRRTIGGQARTSEERAGNSVQRVRCG
jgi:hypothetical protein